MFSGQKFLIPVGIVITAALSGCGVSKVEQCNNLVAVINQGEEFKAEFEEQMTSFTDSTSDIAGIEALKTVANAYLTASDSMLINIQEMTTELNELELEDQTLDNYRNDYSGILSKFSQALVNTNEAMQLLSVVDSQQELVNIIGEFQTKSQSAFEDLNNLSTQENALTANINSYCQAES